MSLYVNNHSHISSTNQLQNIESFDPQTTTTITNIINSALNTVDTRMTVRKRLTLESSVSSIDIIFDEEDLMSNPKRYSLLVSNIKTAVPDGWIGIQVRDHNIWRDAEEYLETLRVYGKNMPLSVSAQKSNSFIIHKGPTHKNTVSSIDYLKMDLNQAGSAVSANFITVGVTNSSSEVAGNSFIHFGSAMILTSNLSGIRIFSSSGDIESGTVYILKAEN